MGAGIHVVAPLPLLQCFLASAGRWLVVAQADERVHPVVVGPFYSDARWSANGQHLAPCNPPFLVRQSARNAGSNLRLLLLVCRATFLLSPARLFWKRCRLFSRSGLTGTQTAPVWG